VTKKFEENEINKMKEEQRRQGTKESNVAKGKQKEKKIEKWKSKGRKDERTSFLM